MTSVLFHFEVPETSPEDESVGLARRVRDHAGELQTSCRWWRSWCDPERDVVVLEGELAPEADVTVLDALHELARGGVEIAGASARSGRRSHPLWTQSRGQRVMP